MGPRKRVRRLAASQALLDDPAGLATLAVADLDRGSSAHRWAGSGSAPPPACRRPARRRRSWSGRGPRSTSARRRARGGAARRSDPAVVPSDRSTARSDQRRPRSVNRSTTRTSSSRSGLRRRRALTHGAAGLVHAVLARVAHVRRPPVSVEEAQLVPAVGIVAPSLDLALLAHLGHTASVGREPPPAPAIGRSPRVRCGPPGSRRRSRRPPRLPAPRRCRPPARGRPGGPCRGPGGRRPGCHPAGPIGVAGPWRLRSWPTTRQGSPSSRAMTTSTVLSRSPFSVPDSGSTDAVDDAVVLEVLGQLHVLGERPAVQGLEHLGPEEADQRARLGHGHVRQRAPGRVDAAGGRVAEVGQVGQLGGPVLHQRARDLDHLDERRSPLLHPGAAARGAGQDREPLGGRTWGPDAG